MQQANDANFLRQALDQARLGRGFTAPNPAVGCIIVCNDQVISKGYHHGPGLPHAEVEALSPLTNLESESATLYVTLEPCCHWGKTPPCTDLVIKRNIKRVVFGFLDPNPLVSGKGQAKLLEKGIQTVHLEIGEIDTFYESYSYWHQHKRPFVTAKLAISFDGKISGASGKPLALSGKECSQFTHEHRKQSDAILTTHRTILADNPQLNVRLGADVIAKPVYLIDRRHSVPTSARIFQTASRVTLFTATSSPALGEWTKAVPETESGLSLPHILNEIGKDGVHDLWVEAGATLFASLVTQRLANRVFLYLCPTWVGERGIPALNTPNLLETAVPIGIFGRDTVYEIKVL